jgi:hypothetical protein
MPANVHVCASSISSAFLVDSWGSWRVMDVARPPRPFRDWRACIGFEAGAPRPQGTSRHRRSPRRTQQALRTLEWIARAENLCICGPSGTGKSHLAEALGHAAIDHGKTVAWHTLESLATLMRRHCADDSVSKAIGGLIRADLIVIDDIGMLAVAPDAPEALFRVVDAAYEQRSIRADVEHPSRGVRRADAQDARCRDRRPAAAPRPRPAHRRDGLLPPRASDRGQGG